MTAEQSSMVRSSGKPGSLSRSAKAISEGIDASIFPEIRQIKSLYREDVSHIELLATIVSFVGMVAVVLSCVGIIGLVSFAVQQRMKEIAIRMALGATRTAVLNAVLRQFRWPVAIGFSAGTMLAAIGSKVLRVALYGINNLDVSSFVVGGALLAVLVSLSMLIPVTRALRLNLATILHSD